MDLTPSEQERLDREVLIVLQHISATGITARIKGATVKRAAPWDTRSIEELINMELYMRMVASGRNPFPSGLLRTHYSTWMPDVLRRLKEEERIFDCEESNNMLWVTLAAPDIVK